MDDEAIIAELIAIRGIGRWTAMMFLILPDTTQCAPRRRFDHGISQNYFTGESVSRSDARERSPPGTVLQRVATWYIWRSLDPVTPAA
jgi:DNA-3-methyladenine glycosylase II